MQTVHALESPSPGTRQEEALQGLWPKEIPEEAAGDRGKI